MIGAASRREVRGIGGMIDSHPHLAVVDSILRHPAINPGVSDDLSEGRVWPLIDIPGVRHWVYIDGDSGRAVGLLSGQLLSATHMLFHGALMPEARRGGRGPQITRDTLAQAARDIPSLRKLSTLTPAYNRPALHLLARCGLKREGVIRRAHLRHGELHDLILTGLEVNGNGH